MEQKLGPAQIEAIYALAERLTGTCQTGRFRRVILETNIVRRAAALGMQSIEHYLQFAEENEEEKKQLLSSLTIHTTFWFRERPHYDFLLECATRYAQESKAEPFCFWSSACSTGQELYSAGLVLECVRSRFPNFEYQLYGTDIDPVSLKKAISAIFPISELNSIDEAYRKWIWMGSDQTEGLFTLDEEIRKRSFFAENNLTSDSWIVDGKTFDFVMCRNVFIYFDEREVARVIQRFTRVISQNGFLCLGHSEVLPENPPGFTFFGVATYRRGQATVAKTIEKQKTVLIVDDSKVLRLLLRKILERAGFVILEADSASRATEVIRTNGVDLVTLDLHMPEEDGHVWLKRMRKESMLIPVIVVTDAEAETAARLLGVLEEGAQDYILKGEIHTHPNRLIESVSCLIHENENYFSFKMSESLGTIDSLTPFIPDVILIGASTGGPEVLVKMLSCLGAKKCPPVILVQHISDAFARALAERLEKACGLILGKNEDGIVLEPGKLYMTFDSQHIGVKTVDGKLKLLRSNDEAMHGHRPAVDFLFSSMSKTEGKKLKALSILLTGMGKDGARGMLDLFKDGRSINLVQDERSSTVYGMPKEAVLLGAHHGQGSPKQIREFIDKCLSILNQ